MLTKLGVTKQLLEATIEQRISNIEWHDDNNQRLNQDACVPSVCHIPSTKVHDEQQKTRAERHPPDIVFS